MIFSNTAVVGCWEIIGAGCEIRKGGIRGLEIIPKRENRLIQVSRYFRKERAPQEGQEQEVLRGPRLAWA